MQESNKNLISNVGDSPVKEANINYIKDLEELKASASKTDSLRQEFNLEKSKQNKIIEKFISKYLLSDTRLASIYNFIENNNIDAGTFIKLVENYNLTSDEVKAIAKSYSKLDSKINLPDSVTDKVSYILKRNSIYSYIDYIDSFDSIEILNVNNIILNTFPSFLINDNLRNLMLNMNETKWAEGVSHINKDRGIYMINANILKTGKETVLVYNYIKYNSELQLPLLVYISSLQGAFWGHKNYNVGNDYFFLLEDKLAINNYISNCFQNIFNNIGAKNTESAESGLSVKNIIDVYKLVAEARLLPTSISDISGIVNLAFHKNYRDLTPLITHRYLDNAMVKNNITQTFNIDLNVINRLVFIVYDLTIFETKIRDLGININQGPQKFRGQTSSINNTLLNLDKFFRDSLYEHNTLLCQNKKYNSKYIKRSFFSYKNIHMGLGNVRW